MAVLDPARPGMHPSVLRLLLSTRKIKKVVYVSCNPASLAANLADLCGPCHGG